MKTTLEQPICKVDPNGTKRWYLHDKLHKLHRINGPSIELPDGRKYWYQNGKLHRINGPAIESPNGRKEWFQNDKLHRINGPSIELPDGRKEWYQNGLCHRIDGPAIEYSDGSKHWYLNGKKVTEQYVMRQSLLIMFMII